jgi:Rrf2 family protein
MLSVTSKYALRALTHLATLSEGETMLGKDLANRAQIPGNYLSKILWTLGSAGLISATRGSGGGYRLRRMPDEIFLMEVVDLFDRSRIEPTCFLGEDRACSDADACAAQTAATIPGPTSHTAE